MKTSRRIISLFSACLLLSLSSGCMTANQMASEANYYEMLSAIAASYQAQPLVRIAPAKEGEAMVFNNVKSIEVFAPPPPLADFAKQYAHRDFTPSWIPAALNAVAPLGFLWGSSLLVKEVGAMAGSNTYNQSISGQGNTATIRQAGNTSLSGGLTGSYNQIGGMIDNTSTPTVVNQPAPIIVTQPQPVIVPPSYPPSP